MQKCIGIFAFLFFSVLLQAQTFNIKIYDSHSPNFQILEETSDEFQFKSDLLKSNSGLIRHTRISKTGEILDYTESFVSHIPNSFDNWHHKLSQFSAFRQPNYTVLTNEVIIEKIQYDSLNPTDATTVFSKSFTFSDYPRANFTRGILQDAQGNWYILGRLMELNPTTNSYQVANIFLLKIDAEGNELWRYETDLSDLSDNFEYFALEDTTADGGALISYHIGGQQSSIMIQVDGNGTEMGLTPFMDQLLEVKHNYLGGFDVLNRNISNNAFSRLYKIRRFDAAGDLIHTLIPTNDISDVIGAYVPDLKVGNFLQLSDGSIVLAGKVSFSYFDFFYSIKYNAAGEVEWTNIEHDFLPDVYQIEQTNDSGFLFWGVLDDLFWIMKTDENGTVPVQDDGVDLELSLFSDNLEPSNGQSNAKAILVNNGTTDATAIEVTFEFENNINLTSEPTITTGSLPAWWQKPLRWNIPTLAAGDTAEIDISLYISLDYVPFYAQVTQQQENDGDSQANNGNFPSPVEDDEAVIVFNSDNNSTCDMTVLVSNIYCDDLGTPDYPWDDQVNFTFTPTNAAEPDAQWLAQYLPQPTGAAQVTGNYDESYEATVNIIPGASDLIQFTVYNQGDLVCAQEVAVLVPDYCSTASCADSIVVKPSTCYDAGTPNNEFDDTFSFDFTVYGSNEFNWIMYNDDQSFAGDVNQTVSLGLFAANAGGMDFTVLFPNQSQCSTVISIEDTQPCSQGGVCAIFPTVNILACDNQGTVEEGDDEYDFEILVEEEHASAAYFLTDETSTTTIFDYNTPILFENYAIADGILTFTIQDTAEVNCTTMLTIEPPLSCSAPTLEPDVQLSMTTNSFPSIYAISSFEVTAKNEGTQPATGTIVQIPLPIDAVLEGGNEYEATAGTPTGMSVVNWVLPDLAANQSETLTLNYFTLTADPITCFAEVIAMNEQDADSTPDNGIFPNPSEDDEAAATTGILPILPPDFRPQNWIIPFAGGEVVIGTTYIVDFSILKSQGEFLGSEVEAALYLSTNDEFDANDIFLKSTTVSGFTEPVSSIPTSIEFTLQEAPPMEFYRLLLIVDPNSLIGEYSELNNLLASGGFYSFTNGNECALFPTIDNIVCDDKGTPDDMNDDTFFFDLTVNGTNVSPNGWIVDLNGLLNGDDYGESLYFSNFSINGGSLPLLISDADDTDCQITLEVEPPAPCSIGNDPKPDLEMEISSQDEPGIYQNISFEITLQNTGTATTTGIEARVPLPNGAVLQGGNEYNTSAGTATGTSDVTWVLPELAAGTSEILTVNYFTLTADPIVVYAEVVAQNEDDLDSSPNNGTPPAVNEDDEATVTLGQTTALADLKMANASLNSQSNYLNVGGSYDFSFDLQNDTGVELTEAVSFSLYLSNDLNFDANADLLIETYDTNNPFTTNTMAIEESFTLPNAVASQIYYFILQVDTNNDIEESNENNNTFLIPQFFIIINSADACGGIFMANSQTELNDFPQNCTTWAGPIFIRNEEITDLTPLSNLDTILNVLHIESTGISDLFELQGLESVNFLELWDNQQLTSLQGFSPDLTIFNPAGYSIYLSGNDALTDLEGIPTLPSYTGGLLMIGNDNLENIEALSALEGDFPNASFIFDDVSSLSSLSGLENITDAAFLAVARCEALEDCCPVAPYLASGEADSLFFGDNLMGCNSAQEILDFCSNTTVDGVDLELSIQTNASYVQWQNATFEVVLTNNGNEAATGIAIEIFQPSGAVFVGGNEGTVSTGDFSVSGSMGIWLLSELNPGQTEILSLNLFVLDAVGVTVYSEVDALNQPDIDSSPNSYNPATNTPSEDDEVAFSFLANQNASSFSFSSNPSEPALFLHNIYPNPAIEQVKLSLISAEEKEGQLKIFNVQGQVVFEQEILLFIGLNEFTVNVRNLPKGVFYTAVSTDKSRCLKRFVKE